ncbi:MAG: flippase [bacterium]
MKKVLKLIGTKKVFALLNKSIPTLNGLLTVFVIIRTIPKYEFGLLALINTFDFALFAFSGGLILQALQKYAAEVDGDELNDLATNSVFLYTTLSLAPAIFVAIFAKNIEAFLNAESLSKLLRWLPLIVVSHWGRKFGYYILLAKEKLVEVFIVDFVPFVISAILLFSLYFSNNLRTALAIVIVRLVSDFGAAAVSLNYLKRDIRLTKKLNQFWLRRLLSFGKYSFGTTIGNLIHARTDTLMIAYFYNPVALAVYNSARGIADFFRTFVQAANMIVLPRASNLFAKSDIKGVRTIYFKGIIFSLILVFPIALIMLSVPKFILNLAYGGKYQESASILQILAFASLISPLGTIGSSVAAGIGKPNLTFIAMWLSVLVNIGLNLLLIPQYGAIGAAYATLAAIVIGGFAITRFVHRAINLSFSKVGKASLTGMVLSVKDKK